MNRFAGLIGNGTAQAEFVSIDRMIHPDAGLVAKFWDHRPADGIRIGRDVPSRSIARLLGRTVVCEPIDTGRDVRIRVAGHDVTRRFSRDIVRSPMSAIFTDRDEFDLRLRTVNEVVATGTPRMMRIVHRCGTVELLRQEAVALPATAPDGVSRWALVFALYF